MEGIKEILELIVGIKDVGLLAKAALKDGKIDLNDLPLLMALLSKQKELVDAISGLGSLPAEVKDLSVEEGVLIIKSLVEAFKEIKDA